MGWCRRRRRRSGGRTGGCGFTLEILRQLVVMVVVMVVLGFVLVVRVLVFSLVSQTEMLDALVVATRHAVVRWPRTCIRARFVRGSRAGIWGGSQDSFGWRSGFGFEMMFWCRF